MDFDKLILMIHKQNHDRVTIRNFTKLSHSPLFQKASVANWHSISERLYTSFLCLVCACACQLSRIVAYLWTIVKSWLQFILLRQFEVMEIKKCFAFWVKLTRTTLEGC